MTEQEAREKWCPMSRLVDSNGSYNRLTTHVPEGMCVASSCMLWVSEGREQNAVKDFGEMKGHCGLAK